MISTRIAIRCDLIQSASKPSNENITDMQNPFRLMTHYATVSMENPNFQATTPT